jgi:uncharacterized protein DUF3891
VIVLRRQRQLVLLRQLDHSALAGQFASAWGNQRFQEPSSRDSVVLAAARHDEGWRESDDETRYDPRLRAPLHFVDADIRDYVALYQAGIQRIVELDPYAGLLVSMHGTGNVCGRWGVQPGIRLSQYDIVGWPPVIEHFVVVQEALQVQLKLGIFGLNPSERRSMFERRLWWHYELLQIWDRLSLFICRMDPDERGGADLGGASPAPEQSDPVAFAVRVLNSDSLTVDPWPFRPVWLQLALPMRRIPDVPYESHLDLIAAVAEAPDEQLTATLMKSESSLVPP